MNVTTPRLAPTNRDQRSQAHAGHGRDCFGERVNHLGLGVINDVPSKPTLQHATKIGVKRNDHTNQHEDQEDVQHLLEQGQLAKARHDISSGDTWHSNHDAPDRSAR
jgi:hypothetical protein